MRGLKSLLDFFAGRRGGVATIFAVAAVPLTLLTGVGVDYALAIDRQMQLNAAADSAVLAAITPAMMTQTTTIATQAATDTFNAQAGTIAGVTYAPADISVNIATIGAKRVATLHYAVLSQTIFAGVLNMNAIHLSGGSQGTGGEAPNIDFYLLLDDSPSMAIAATQTGINTMVSYTSKQGGCAFGCHEAHPSQDNLGNPNGEDNYALAQSLGVTLRMDLVRQAAQNLMATAQTSEATSAAAYRMAIYTFDVGFNTIAPLTSNLPAAQTQAGNIQLQPVYANNWLTSSNSNSDTDTNYDAAMSGINAAMPNPGSGTATPGDSPQEVLFFVTDGVEDEMSGGSRVESLMDPTWCTKIKARGIRIAVLYTEYLPLPTNSWYNTHISPFQANIGPTLQSCASPGLYTKVQTGGDISAALATLFQYAVQSAYLSQ